MAIVVSSCPVLLQEVQSVRSLLSAEQARCFKLEVRHTLHVLGLSDAVVSWALQVECIAKSCHCRAL